jgi:hypothetical protein
MAVCKYHPERSAIGVCVRCRTTICAACCTRLDGVNHCHACLEILARAREVLPAGRGVAVLGAICVLALAWLVLFGMLTLMQGSLAP